MKAKMTLSKESENMTLEEAYQKFIRVKKILNLSEATIKHYNCTYNQFTQYLDKYTLCVNISIDTIYGFIDFLKKRNCNIRVKSINTYLIDLRAFFNYLADEEIIKRFKISLLRDDEKVKETYTDTELEKLLKKPNLKKASFSEYRNWVIVNYLLGTGNRASTLCHLKVEDIDFDNHEIILKKLKAKRQYIIPMSAVLEKILKEYLEYRKPKSQSDFVFCNQYGEPLVYMTLRTAIGRYNLSRGVTKTSIHLFRHTFAKKWILNGGDMFRLQRMLGHKSLEMVKNYVNMFDGDLKNSFDVFNPLDNIKINNRQHLKLKQA